MKLKELREEIGLTQKELAERLNIGYTTYNAYEKGTNEPNINIIIRLADFFNVTIDELFGRNKNIKPNILQPYQKEIFEKIQDCDAYECGLISGYIDRIATERRNREQQIKLKKFYDAN